MDSVVVGFAAPEGRPSVAQGATLGTARTGEDPPPAPEGRPSQTPRPEGLGATVAPPGLGEMGRLFRPQGFTLGY